MTKLVLIRHAEVTHSNNQRCAAGAYQFDPHVTSAGVKDVIHAVDGLDETLRMPELLLVSPLLRTRETADVALSRSLRPGLGRFIDLRLTEFFGNQGRRGVTSEKLRQGLSPATEALFNKAKGKVLDPNETEDELRARVASFVSDLGTSSAKVSWVVAHGFTFQMLESLLTHTPIAQVAEVPKGTARVLDI